MSNQTILNPFKQLVAQGIAIDPSATVVVGAETFQLVNLNIAQTDISRWKAAVAAAGEITVSGITVPVGMLASSVSVV